ncbi:MAG: hypothetical protein JKY96_07360 [Phycisphaerales bacterium]|nr:hypothetical protein [Phycisphaerales bacterium]
MDIHPVIRIPGHLALWPTLYTLGVLILAEKLIMATTPQWAPLCFVAFCAHGCYLLDRVKTSDARLDPADLLAQPKRYEFIHKHTRILRPIILLDLVLAIAASIVFNPMLAWVPLAALWGVHLYAGRRPDPSRPRLKDLPALKAFFIAGAHLALALATILGEHGYGSLADSSGLFFTVLAMGAIVFGDAVLCDLDDQQSDEQFQTRSIPVLVGHKSAWLLAIGSHVLALSLLMLSVGWTPALSIVGGTLLFTNGVFTLLRRQRDAVDARLLVLAVFFVALSN